MHFFFFSSSIASEKSSSAFSLSLERKNSSLFFIRGLQEVKDKTREIALKRRTGRPKPRLVHVSHSSFCLSFFSFHAALQFNVRRSCLCVLSFVYVAVSSSPSSFIEASSNRLSVGMKQKKLSTQEEEEKKKQQQPPRHVTTAPLASSSEFLSHAFFQIASECLSSSSSPSSSSSSSASSTIQPGERDTLEKHLGLVCEELAYALRVFLTDLNFSDFYSDLLLQSLAADLFPSSSSSPH